MANAVGDNFLTGEKKGFIPPDCDEVDPTLCDPENNNSARERILDVVNYLLTFVGLIAIIAIIYYGFLWITSGGEEDQFTKGKKGVIYVAAGIILILLSYAIVNFLISAGTGIPQDGGGNTPNNNGQDGNDGNNGQDGNDGNNGQDGNDGNNGQDGNDGNNGQDGKTEVILQDPSSVQTIRDFKTIVQQIRLQSGLNTNEVQNLKQILNTLLQMIPKEKAETIRDILDPLKEKTEITPKEAKNIADSVEKILLEIDILPKMTAVIEASPISGNAPLTVSLDGMSSLDPTQTTIPSQNYKWSYVDENGVLQSIGGGPVKKVTFKNPGLYVVKLEVSSASKNPIFGAVATRKIRVSPTETNALFTINGNAVGSIIRLSLKSAREGVLFDPSLSTVSDGAEIVEYLWSFNGRKESFLKPEVTKQIFPKSGSYPIRLTVVENTKKTFTQEVFVEVESSLAVITLSKRNPKVGEVVFLDGFDSVIQEKSSLLRFLWKISGPDSFSQEFSDGRASIQFPKPGKYSVSLSVTDASGNSAEAIDEIVVESAPPTAIFSAEPLDLSHPSIFRFNGTMSRDPENEPLLFSWDFDGDGIFDSENSSESVVEFSFSEARNYRPRLRVTDPNGKWDEITRDIGVKFILNVDFTASTFVAQRGEEIRFSTIAPGGIAFYWDFDDGQQTTASQESTAHIFEKEGKYAVTLTVFNDRDQKNSITKTIYVGDGLSPVPVIQTQINNLSVIPTKNLCGEGKDGVVLFRNESLQLSGVDSVNIDGSHENLKFSWDYHDGTFEEGSSVKHRYSELSQEGKCEQISLTANDEITGIMRKSPPLFVFVKNAPPQIARFIARTPSEVCSAPCRVDLFLEGVRDPDGQVKNFRWWAVAEGSSEKIDFHTTNEPSTTITIPSHGVQNSEFSVRFVAEAVDSDDAKISSDDVFGISKSITVKNGENPSPIVDFFVDRVFVKAGESINFTAIASDPLGTPLPKSAYAWDFDGDGTFDDTSSGANVTHKFQETGDFSVRLRVTIRGVSASKARTIFVSQKKDYPVADFVFQKKGERILLDASLSRKNPEIPGNTLSYFWDFDTAVDSDGNKIPYDDRDATGVRASANFSETNSVKIRLVVENILGEQSTKEKTISSDIFSQLEEEEKSTLRRTLRVSANVPMTTLELTAPRPLLALGEVISLFAFGVEANGDPIQGVASFEILDAQESKIDPESVSFSSGTAETQLTAGGTLGRISIRVRAHSLLGEIFEDLSLRVQK